MPAAIQIALAKAPGRKSRNAAAGVFPQLRAVGDANNKDQLLISHEELNKKKIRYVDEDESPEKETSHKSKHQIVNPLNQL
jgi:hypothetical protein